MLQSNQNILIALGLFLALSLLALLFFSPAASADPLDPDAPGLIAGVAKNAAGEPLADIQVTLFSQSFNSPDFWGRLRSVTTESDGKYQFVLLPVGVYRIGAISTNALYAQLYYPTAPIIYKATDLAIAGNQITSVDLILQPGGQIMGAVTTTVGSSLNYGGYVELWQTLVRQRIIYWGVVQRASLPTGGGVYSFTNLASDVYRVCAGDYADFMHVVSNPYFGGLHLISTNINTDAQGQYTLKGLHAGDYHVCFRQSTSDYNKCYGAATLPYGNYNNSAGRPVNVTAGATSANIDVIWDPDLQSYLPITAR